jgi:hypothetical protein
MAKQKKPSQKALLLPIVAVAVSVITLGTHLYLINQQNESAKLEAKKKQDVKLPANAVKLSGCVPYMGEHWAVPELLPDGPIYFTHNGKVVGIEFMVGPEDIPNEQLAKAKTPQEAIAYMQSNNLTFADTVYPHFTRDLKGYDIKFMSLEWTPPHAGYVAPHYDLHYYFIDKSEVDQICPDSKIENIDTPEIRQRLDELNIPYPGSEQQTP